jgi:hypothetical protein
MNLEILQLRKNLQMGILQFIKIADQKFADENFAVGKNLQMTILQMAFSHYRVTALILHRFTASPL